MKTMTILQAQKNNYKPEDFVFLNHKSIILNSWEMIENNLEINKKICLRKNLNIFLTQNYIPFIEECTKRLEKNFPEFLKMLN